MNKDNLTYYFIRIITLPFFFIPYKIIHKTGNLIGYLSYFILTNYRKRALSNLALAKSLNLNNKQIKKYAIKSFQNLAITILEYPKFFFEKNLKKVFITKNEKPALELYNKNMGIIFFVSHLSNWESLFLNGTLKMKGIAIAKPIKNKKLYSWIKKIREKNSGKIIEPKNALKEALKNLKKGIFVGLVADQAMPDSGYSYPFFNRRSFNTTSPALLSYKTKSPIIVATTKRENGKYIIKYSDPIFPNLEEKKEIEIKNLMDKSLKILENEIKKNIGEYFWQHNIYKQQSLRSIYKRFRLDSILIILPKDQSFFEIKKHLHIFKEIYPKEFIFILCPDIFENEELIKSEEIIYYNDYKQTLLDDYRFKLIFNFTPYLKIEKHFLKKAAFEILNIKKLQKISTLKTKNLSTLLKKAMLREKNAG
jgi:KDO2-lipid IV(A) lauroyltransferase